MRQGEAVKEIVLERVIRQEEERGYHLELPFELPDRTEELQAEIEIEPLGEGRVTIDLGLRDASRVRGWSGGARTRFSVGRERATPGYRPGELAPGAWAVLLGAYRVPPAGCRVVVRLRCLRESPRWLKGDLHAHTVHSDGSYTLGDAVAIMEGLGCDFLATTDHNTASQNYAHPRESSVVLIPGMELTTNDGHANLLGVVDPVADFRVRRLEDVRARFAEAKAKGAVVVLNHPHCGDCPWEWGFEVEHDWLEVWNGPWTDRNERALAWWQGQLAAGRRLVAVGGSDVHKPHPHVRHAHPTMWAYADSRTSAGILASIGRGRAFISESPDGPTVELSIGAAMMGDTASPADTEQGGRLRADRLQPGDRVLLLTERGAEAQWSADRAGPMLRDWPAERDRLFYRVEVRRHCPLRNASVVAALTNPIYLRC